MDNNSWLNNSAKIPLSKTAGPSSSRGGQAAPRDMSSTRVAKPKQGWVDRADDD